MRFEWDARKNNENIKKHGFDFVDGWEIFEYPILAKLDERFDYGEDRWNGIGSFRGRIMVVTFTQKDDETIRFISIRKALRHEREAYEEQIKNRS